MVQPNFTLDKSILPTFWWKTGHTLCLPWFFRSLKRTLTPHYDVLRLATFRFQLHLQVISSNVGFNPSPFWTKKKKQQVLAYTVSECWGHTNDATPEAHWQVCAGAGLDLRAADAHRWQILTSFEARPWVDVLVITMCCFLTRAVQGIFRRLKPDSDVHLPT